MKKKKNQKNRADNWIEKKYGNCIKWDLFSLRQILFRSIDLGRGYEVYSYLYMAFTCAWVEFVNFKLF